MTDAASWLVKPMRRHHALPHSFIIRREMFTLQQACASTCPAARPLHAHSHSSLGPFSCIIQHARFLGFGPPTCSDPTFFEAKARSLICQGSKATKRKARHRFQNGARKERPLDSSEAYASDVRGSLALSYAEHAVVGPLSASA